MSAELQIGYSVGGRYVVEKFIGEGGMQLVYKAKDTLTDRLVALKTPKNSSATKRFKRSAVLAAKVNHPNVAKTLDYMKIDGKRFLVEELIMGKDLSEALMRESSFLDPYLCAKVLHHLAKGVAAAHHAGVVHRDLKPTNIMISGGYSINQLKVTDFGISRMAGEEMKEAIEGGDASLSASKTAVGALPYMAPEAIENPAKVDPPADIWSIGAMMFHLLCGSFPFGSGLRAVPRILEAKIPDIPPFVYSNPQFSPLAREIIAISVECISKDPAKRPNADQLVRKCSELCYSSSFRERGVVRRFDHNAYGFIDSVGGDIFYHKDCVYGPLPKAGDRVIFAQYVSGDAPRAMPVIKLDRIDD